MQRSIMFTIFILIAGLIASTAFGQVDAGVTVATATDVSGLVGTLLKFLPWVVVAASALTAIFPSTNKIMLIIDKFAFAWGKARNDPAAQRWGK